MANTIISAAALVGTRPRINKKSGTPTRSAPPKQISCRFVSPSTTLDRVFGRRDEILGGQTGRSQPVPFKAERHLFIHVENAVKLCQPRLAVQGLGGHAQAFEVVENVGLNALQDGAWRP